MGINLLFSRGINKLNNGVGVFVNLMHNLQYISNIAFSEITFWSQLIFFSTWVLKIANKGPTLNKETRQSLYIIFMT